MGDKTFHQVGHHVPRVIIIALGGLVLTVGAGELGYLPDHMAVLSAGALTSPLPAKVEADRRTVEIAQATPALPAPGAASGAAPPPAAPARIEDLINPNPEKALQDVLEGRIPPPGPEVDKMLERAREVTRKAPSQNGKQIPPPEPPAAAPPQTGKRIPRPLDGNDCIVPVLFHGRWLDFVCRYQCPRCDHIGGSPIGPGVVVAARVLV
jgi:hypothetical protein